MCMGDFVALVAGSFLTHEPGKESRHTFQLENKVLSSHFCGYFGLVVNHAWGGEAPGNHDVLPSLNRMFLKDSGNSSPRLMGEV